MFGTEFVSLRELFFGRSTSEESGKHETGVPQIQDDQPRNHYNRIHILSGHTNVIDILLKIDDFRFLSCGQDKKVIIWDSKTAQIALELQGHSRPVTCAIALQQKLYCCDDAVEGDAIAEDPVVLVSASSDETLRVWDLFSGRCLKVVTEHGGIVKCIAVCHSFECSLIITGGEDLCLWTHSFRLLSKFQRSSRDYVHTIISIKGGRFVAASDKQSLTVYDIMQEVNELTGATMYSIQELKILQPHRKSITSLVQVSDAMFASASMDGTIVVWSAHRLSATRKFNYCETFYDETARTFPYAVHYLHVNEEKYLFAAIGSGFGVYDAGSERCLVRIVNAHHASVTCLRLLDGGNLLATSSCDGTVRLWGAPHTETSDSALRSRIAESPVSRLFGVSIRDTSSQLKLELVGLCSGHSNSIQRFVECGTEGFVSCSTDGVLVLWKDSRVVEKREDDFLRSVMERSGWIRH